jgi:hypothetical protein
LLGQPLQHKGGTDEAGPAGYQDRHIQEHGSIAVFVGEEVGGRCRSEEKSKNGTFPPRLEIPQVQQDFHFSHRPCRDDQYVDFPV